MSQVKTLSVGDRVTLTREGAQAHQRHHDDHVEIIKKVSSNPVIKVATETAKNLAFTFPKSGVKGTVIEVQQRWWWQSGSDYLIQWDNGAGRSWHLSEHLVPTR
jgi:hypothetical protein